MRRLLLGVMAVGLLLTWCACAQALDDEDRLFLREMERDTAFYFWEQANPKNGLIKDNSEAYSPCSIAAVGFGLVSLCVMEKQGWKSREEIQARVLRTLRTLRDKVEHERGFFYHFVSMNNGGRVWQSEASSIDTALLIAGALFAGQYFKGTEIEDIAQELYRRVEWPWMLNEQGLLCMGYTPEAGFLPYYWDSYNEGMLLYALAMGSPSHPIPKESWWAWRRPLTESSAGPMVYCTSGSLFVYQYPHAFIDFRKVNDGVTNHWKNSVTATLANRYFCIENAEGFRTYGKTGWGITACLGPDGYKGYGAEPADQPLHDGTVAPSGVAGSLPFAPTFAAQTLRAMRENYGRHAYGPYGFYDAFNVDRGYWAKSYIGIDQGISVLMIENLLADTVWDHFMELPAIRRWAEGIASKPAAQKAVIARSGATKQSRRASGSLPSGLAAR